MRRILTISIVAVLIATAFSASAFTTGYADRTATIDVVSDDTGLIGLSAGNSGTDQIDTSGDQLQINFATGANEDAYFELGDPASGNETYAFNVTNNDGTAHTLELNYTMDDSSFEGDGANVTFEVYKSGSSTSIFTASEESIGTSSPDAVAAGETVHVVVKVDTTGLDASTGDALSGNLRVKLS